MKKAVQGCRRSPSHQRQRQRQQQQRQQQLQPLEQKQQKQQPERPLSTSTAKLMKGLPRRLRMGEEEEKLRRHLRVACASERACAREKGGGAV